MDAATLDLHAETATVQDAFRTLCHRHQAERSADGIGITGADDYIAISA